MPRIDHVALWAKNLEDICAFYRDAFDAQVGPIYENPNKGFTSRFLTFESGARVEVMSSTSLALASKGPGAQALGLVHLAVSLGSEAAVDRLTETLRAKGVPVLDGPRRTGDGYYESVVLDPEGNRIEITA